MSVRSTLVTVVAVISVLAGLVALPIHANNDLPFNWVRNLNGTAWGYTQAEDPSEYGSEGLVDRFELRMGIATETNMKMIVNLARSELN